MDWNMILFVTKWAAIGLFYAILLLLLFGVYREMARGAPAARTGGPVLYGRLRVLANGDDKNVRINSFLDLRPVTRLGAEQDNDLVLRDSFVSGHHARLRWDGAGWWVEDLNSKNGTRVNHQRCAPRVPQRVANGSILTIGDMEFELIDPEPAGMRDVG